MASDTEGIAALFSMYNDDDEEDDSDEPGPPPSPPPPPPAAATSPSTSPRTGGESSNPNSSPTPSPEHSSRSLRDEQAAPQTLASPQLSPGLLPLPSRPSSPSPPRPSLTATPPGLPRPPRRGALAIVDYAHDEIAMSPDQEDGEIMSGMGGLGSDAQGNLEETVLSGTVHILTPNILSEASQHSDAPEQSQVGGDVAMDATETDTEDTRVEEASDISPNVQNDDPSSSFLPPSVTTKCSAALQQKINKFLAYKRAGKSFNAEVRNRKDYRNPDFLQHAVRYQEIDQIGTCFSKDVFNPYGYDKSDYYDEIEADMKRELERKEQEKKRNPKVDFISSGVQPPINPSIAKISAAISAAAAVASASGPAAAESLQKEARSNKKSKWDKVDGDSNPAAPNDNLSAAGVSAALLTSGNGYAAFAQQKRKEAEQKRTSDYKSDRRS